MLPQCVQLWGWNVLDSVPNPDMRCALLASIDFSISKLLGTDNFERKVTTRNGKTYTVPRVPHKFWRVLAIRSKIFREIANMSSLKPHPNVLQFYGVLESVKDTSAQFFLLLELARGGELFQRYGIRHSLSSTSH